MEYKKNDCVTVTIEDMSTEGEGIGKVDGFTLFVKDTVPGDTVEARVVKNKKSYAYARLEKVLSPSPFRVEPRCAYHRQCGGCQLQALSYEKQLEFKQQKIRNNLIRIGGFSPEYIDERMEPVIGMEEPFHYRNKAQYPVGTDKDGNVVTGFYAGRTHSIIANTDCHLGVSENREILEVILKHMNRYNVPPYDEATGKGLVRHVLIRKGFASGEIMVCLVVNKRVKPGLSAESQACIKGNVIHGRSTGRQMDTERQVCGWSQVSHSRCTANLPCNAEEDAEIRETDKNLNIAANMEFLPEQSALLEELAAITGVASVSVSINTERTNVIMGKEIYILWGSPVISDIIHVRDMQREGYPFTGTELTFCISPLSFYQVNPVQTEKLYSLALEYAGLTGEETVWDLYCGIGTISLFLAGSAKKVYGVEIIPQAIRDARENARRNGIRNAEFFVGKAEEVLPGFYESGCEYADSRAEDGRGDVGGRGNAGGRAEDGRGEVGGRAGDGRGDADGKAGDGRGDADGRAGDGRGDVDGRAGDGRGDVGGKAEDDPAESVAGDCRGKDEEVEGSREPRESKELEGSETGLDTGSNADMRHPDIIVVDPPRKGCDQACLDTMLKMRPERIVYVSCDSATLARDLKTLCEGGYEIVKVRGVDQFGMTVHVEVACCLQRKDS